MSNAEEIVRLRAMLVEQFEKDAEQFEKDAEQFEKDAEQFEKDVLTVIQYGSDR
jgi:ABC-type Zn uptake system ZnuABC Zn-binding protein ZnuA